MWSDDCQRGTVVRLGGFQFGLVVAEVVPLALVRELGPVGVLVVAPRHTPVLTDSTACLGPVCKGEIVVLVWDLDVIGHGLEVFE